MKKRLYLIACMLLCLLTASVGVKASAAADFDEEDLSSVCQDLIDEWFSYDFAQMLEEYSEELQQEGYEDIKAEYEQFAKLQESCGAYESTGEFSYEYKQDDDGNDIAVATVVVNGENAQIDVKVTFDSASNLTDYEFSEHKEVKEDVSKSEVMKKAGLNTIMAISIVFVVLIVIALLISCFIFIHNIQNKATAKEPVKAAKTPAAPVNVEEEELMDDLELVAVITAAIVAASGSENSSDLVVRSIKRVR